MWRFRVKQHRLEKYIKTESHREKMYLTICAKREAADNSANIYNLIYLPFHFITKI